MSRNVFITGVSSGIGRGLAEECLRQDCEVYGVSRRESAELKGHPKFHFKALDLRELDGIEPGLRDLFAGLKKLDLAILNAGILGKIADLRETSLEDIQPVIDVNLWANKVIIDTLAKLDLEVSQIVTISSGAAVSAKRGWNAYSISKAALNMLTGLYAAELPEIHFCALAPGIVDTHMQDQLSSLPDDGRFSSIEMLRNAKGTPLMPEPGEAAGRLLTAMDRARKYPSGSFLDVNTLVKTALV